jgi:hypothetical protein
MILLESYPYKLQVILMKYGVLFKTNNHLPSRINIDSQVNERVVQGRSIFNEFFFAYKCLLISKKQKLPKLGYIYIYKKRAR